MLSERAVHEVNGERVETPCKRSGLDDGRGSFDSMTASLRDAATALRMTIG
jgi:hypothetical protein